MVFCCDAQQRTSDRVSGRSRTSRRVYECLEKAADPCFALWLSRISASLPLGAPGIFSPSTFWIGLRCACIDSGWTGLPIYDCDLGLHWSAPYFIFGTFLKTQIRSSARMFPSAIKGRNSSERNLFAVTTAVALRRVCYVCCRTTAEFRSRRDGAGHRVDTRQHQETGSALAPRPGQSPARPEPRSTLGRSGIGCGWKPRRR